MKITWERIGNGVWRAIWWTTIAPPYDVYCYGEKLDTTSNNYYIFEIDPIGDPNNVCPPEIEIVAKDADSDYVTNPNRMYLQWYHQTGATAYLIYKYVDGEPVWQQSLSDYGEQYYSYHSEPLDPGEYRFVVVAINEYADQMIVRDQTKKIVSYPAGLEQVVDVDGFMFNQIYENPMLYFEIINE